MSAKISELPVASSFADSDVLDGLQGGANKQIPRAVLLAGTGAYGLFVHFDDAGNVGTAETDLYSDTVAANELANDGDALIVQYTFGWDDTTVSNDLELKVYFAGTALLDFLLTSSGNIALIDLTIIRTSSTSVRYVDAFNAVVGDLAGIDLTDANIVKVTGRGFANNDVFVKTGLITKVPVP
jgi:hypothetical protein